MSFFDTKQVARRQLHEKLKRPALYIVEGEDPLPVNVRIHTEVAALGEVRGTSFDYAEKQEVIPQIVFLREEVASPERLAVVSVSVDEAYRIDHTLPPDGITIIAKVSRLLAQERVGLPVP